ncbi:MAG: hypothetical protein JSV16_03185 [Candidatus Hydrogenedentota bacterium]|nr:MAG: hypothetical protein JSV16_03185 [Candidatus Hydrogenedentota bacterium]
MENAPICGHCQVPMKMKRHARHSQLVAFGLIVIGVLLCFTCIGAVFGIPAIAVGLYLGAAAEKVWLCPKCRTFIPRA